MTNEEMQRIIETCDCWECSMMREAREPPAKQDPMPDLSGCQCSDCSWRYEPAESPPPSPAPKASKSSKSYLLLPLAGLVWFMGFPWFFPATVLGVYAVIKSDGEG